MFGENPSEANVFKPFDVYEAVGSEYLTFLDGLSMEVWNFPAEPCHFEVDCAADFTTEGDLLVMLDRRHLKGVRVILCGRARQKPERALSYRLDGLTHVLRFHHRDARCAFRYFTDNAYDALTMRSDYLLIKRGAGFLDFLVPSNLTDK